MEMTPANPAFDILSNPAIRNLHIEAWIQAKIKEESLQRSIVADFNRLPHDMKYLFVRAHRPTLQQPEFWALAIGFDTTFIGDGRSIIYEDWRRGTRYTEVCRWVCTELTLWIVADYLGYSAREVEGQPITTKEGVINPPTGWLSMSLWFLMRCSNPYTDNEKLGDSYQTDT